ncbi:MFS transporter [Streptomyces sp. NBC_00237]|uniref:MFS transporter n=1 Tax=Streptomyces sp. NBC_00237 TaxID=2975687 RepID=UPI00225294B3|nr:MFS transporter [Streptomyces sp. NBC_00237]MCX5204139.1 MFS transporter [Streptomyces sp. NBC_00237]
MPDGPSTPAPAKRIGYLALFRVREFRPLFLAHLLSLLGVAVSEIALTVLVYELTSSPFLSALTFALGLLPYLLGGTLLSGIADRYPARRVLVVCDLICAVCVAVMVWPGTPVAGLLALRCLVAAVAPVFAGTRMATLADILGDGDLYILGRSLLRIVSQSSVLIGFGAGGLLLAVVSPRGAIAVTAGTFLCSALLLRFGTRKRPARLTSKEGGSSLLRDSLDGARLVFRDRLLRAQMLLFWMPAFFVVTPEALSAAYADRIGASAAALGLIMCGMPVGHIAAELYAGSALSPRARSRLVFPAVSLGLVPLVAYLAVPGMAWTVVLQVLVGMSGAYIIGLDQWFVEALPEELRGRATTLQTAGLMTVQGLGMALAGLAAEFVPVQLVVAGAGAIGTLCTLLLVGELRRATVRRNTGPERTRTEPRDKADQHMTDR